MSNAIYPVLPGQAFPRIRMPRWETQITSSDSGRDWATTGQLAPRYTYKIPYNYLRAADFDLLMGFFNARKGRADTFLFEDRDDKTVSTPQVIGTGNGTTTKFPLLRTLGGFTEQVGRHKTITQVRINGSATAAYTLGDDGSITFNTAPANGAVLDWTGEYYWRCRFVQDAWEFTEFVRLLRSLARVEFETVKA